MIDSYIRPSVQGAVFEPTVSKFGFHNITPLQITIAALVMGLGCAVATVIHMPLWALFFLALSGVCDILDGTVARMHKQTSTFGAVMDITVDRVVESAIILGLCLVDPTGRGLLCTLMLASVLLCITTFLVVGIFTKNEGEKGFHYSPGIMERTEAFIFFGAMILVPAYFGVLAVVFTVLVTLTALIRLGQFAKQA